MYTTVASDINLTFLSLKYKLKLFLFNIYYYNFYLSSTRSSTSPTMSGLKKLFPNEKNLNVCLAVTCRCAALKHNSSINVYNNII